MVALFWFYSSIIIITLVSKIILLDIFNFLIRKITNCVFIFNLKKMAIEENLCKSAG